MVRSPFVELGPGPAPDAAKLIKIGSRTFSSQGSFHITTVLVSPGAVSYPEAVRAWLNPKFALYDKEQIYPPNQSRKQVDAHNAQDMTRSQQSAARAALQELGLAVPDGASIAGFSKESKARDVLKQGDLVVGVDGKPVKSTTDLTPLVKAHRPGDVARVAIRRGDQTLEVNVPVIESAEKPGVPVLGVFVSTDVRLPFDVKIDSQSIGGPSAGLVFALSIFDALDAADLTGGRTIAGTGTIDNDGRVGPIGGIEQKILGAEQIHARVFILPREELLPAKKALPKGSRMKLIPVSTLHEAIEALRNSK